MTKPNFAKLTKSYSTTFYKSTLLFPSNIKKEVFALYVFLRKCDDLADTIRDLKKFYDFKTKLFDALDKNSKTNNIHINAYIELHRKYDFNRSWVEALFESLETDFNPNLTLKKYKDLERYIYGVADVVGLMMAKIMKLDPKAYSYAQKLGKAMQLVNIIRDIKEDIEMGRVYIPQEDLKKFKIDNLKSVSIQKRRFKKLVSYETARARDIFNKSKKGFSLIPFKMRWSILMSTIAYEKLLSKLEKNPDNIWRGKVKLSKPTFYVILVKSFFVNFKYGF